MRPPLRLSPVDAVVLWQPARYWPPGTCPWWWNMARRFMQPGFGHCLVLFYDPDGDAYCVLDPVFGGVQARAISAATLTLRSLIRQYPASHWAIVRRDRHDCPPLVRGPLTCVSVAKAVLGLGGRSWTPYQLWRQVTAIPGVMHGGIPEAAPEARRSQDDAGAAEGTPRRAGA